MGLIIKENRELRAEGKMDRKWLKGGMEGIKKKIEEVKKEIKVGRKKWRRTEKR